MERKRPLTNLVMDPQFQLPKDALKENFLCIFNKTYTGHPLLTLFTIGISPIIPSLGEAVNPKATKRGTSETSEQRKFRLDLRAGLRKWSETRKGMLSPFLRIKKVNTGDPHFVVSVPLTRTGSDVHGLLSKSGPLALLPLSNEQLEAAALVFDHGSWSTQEVLPTLTGIEPDLLAALKSSLLGVRISKEGHDGILFLDFKLRKEEAEYLVSTPWLSIRPVDIYPMLQHWIGVDYVPREYGRVSFPLSKVVSTIPQLDKNDTRIDQYGISIDRDGRPNYFPLECNNVAKYEDMFSSQGQEPDGTFCMNSIDSPKSVVLPKNIPVFVDWLNAKFTYTDGNGKPNVWDLASFRKCDAGKAMRLITQRYVPDRYLSIFMNYSELASVSTKAGAYIDKDAILKEYEGETANLVGRFISGAADMSVADYFDEAVKVAKLIHNQAEFYPTYTTLTMGAEALFHPCAKFLQALFKGMLPNMDAIYSTYAVSTVTPNMGYLSLLVNYGKNLSQTHADADTLNAAAKDQGVTPGWVPPALPLLAKKLTDGKGGLLPHQGKIRNLLKDSPDSAALDVSAGGGKSLLLITDILNEFKANRSAPYLLMCPSYLVPNYVSEIVEFTDGKLNAIPLTSWVLGRGAGFRRVDEILSKAPRNTVVVMAFDCLKFGKRSTAYGTSRIDFYPVLDMLRQYQFGYVGMDESHLLKNPKSQRTKAINCLVAEIQKRRLASGTLNPDSPSDLPSQVGLLDPTIFGTRDEFNEKYGLEVKGNRVTKWRNSGPNALSTVLPTLKQSVVWASAARKEWACLLPDRVDRFIKVVLTEKQKEFYDALFDEMVAQIKAEAKEANKKGKQAKRLLEKLEGSGEDQVDEVDDEDDDDDVEGDLGPALQPHLAALEAFVTNPLTHPYTQTGIAFMTEHGVERRVPPLKGDDLKSPKVVAIRQILEEHLANPRAGKVLIFTNFNVSTDSVFDEMPPALQACGIRYRTRDSEALIDKFKNDPKIRWMVGIHTSLEVGHNLQVASRLIRAEGIWTPGEQEQGDSRIMRPKLKGSGEDRDKLYFDTIVADHTIDVTKAARLRAKMVALAKFENPNDMRYQAIEDIPLIRMTLNEITTKNDFSTNLLAYQTAMAELNSVTKADYAEYKERLEKEGGLHIVHLEAAPTPKDAMLLSAIPYAKGTELYTDKTLGLKRVDSFLQLEPEDLSDDEDEEGGEVADDESDTDDAGLDLAAREAARARKEELSEQVVGQRAHTEFGDGEIIRMGFRRSPKGPVPHWVRVRLDDGTTIKVLPINTVFVITKPDAVQDAVRTEMSKHIGLPLTAPITTMGVKQFETTLSRKEQIAREKEEEQKRAAQKRLFEKKQQRKLSVSFKSEIVNGYLSFSYSGTDEDTIKALQSFGFKRDLQYYYAQIANPRILQNQMLLWQEKGFSFDKATNEALSMVANRWNQLGLSTHKHVIQMATKSQLQNYQRTMFKPSSDRKAIKPFPLVLDGGTLDSMNIRRAEKYNEGKRKSQHIQPEVGRVYLCLPIQGQAGTPQALKYRGTRITWKKSKPSLSLTCAGKSAAAKFFTGLVAAGIQVANADEIRKVMSTITVKPRTTGADFLGEQK